MRWTLLSLRSGRFRHPYKFGARNDTALGAEHWLQSENSLLLRFAGSSSTFWGGRPFGFLGTCTPPDAPIAPWDKVPSSGPHCQPVARFCCDFCLSKQSGQQHASQAFHYADRTCLSPRNLRPRFARVIVAMALPAIGLRYRARFLPSIAFVFAMRLEITGETSQGFLRRSRAGRSLWRRRSLSRPLPWR